MVLPPAVESPSSTRLMWLLFLNGISVLIWVSGFFIGIDYPTGKRWIVVLLPFFLCLVWLVWAAVRDIELLFASARSSAIWNISECSMGLPRVWGGTVLGMKSRPISGEMDRDLSASGL
jgi:hypothetical protein